MSTATDMLAKYHEAELAILDGQTVRWGHRELGLPDLAEIRTGRQEWERKVRSEQNPNRPGWAVATFSDD